MNRQASTALALILLAGLALTLAVAQPPASAGRSAPPTQSHFGPEDQPRLVDPGSAAADDQLAAEGRFTFVDIYADCGATPLAAYQIELLATHGTFKIVGIEGGAHPAFAEPPYYDPAALYHERVILAAFSTDDDLPVGRTRVARVHVLLEAETPVYAVKLMAAATADGTPIDLGLEVEGDAS